MPYAPAVHTITGYTHEQLHVSTNMTYRNEAGDYAMYRLAYLPADSLQVGLMAASPDGDGFEVTFEDFHLKPEDGAKPAGAT